MASRPGRRPEMCTALGNIIRCSSDSWEVAIRTSSIFLSPLKQSPWRFHILILLWNYIKWLMSSAHISKRRTWRRQCVVSYSLYFQTVISIFCYLQCTLISDRLLPSSSKCWMQPLKVEMAWIPWHNEEKFFFPLSLVMSILSPAIPVKKQTNKKPGWLILHILTRRGDSHFSRT